MNKINNKTAFDSLLDQYSDESYNLYVIVKSLCDYPNVDREDYADLSGKLYSTAFALLMSNYLHSVVDMYENDDFQEYVYEMDFEYDERKIYKMIQIFDIEPEDDFPFLVEQLVEEYKKIIINDLNSLFTDNHNVMKLFASIFQFNEGQETDVDVMGLMDFFQEV